MLVWSLLELHIIAYTKSAETLYNEGDQFTGNYSGITYIKLEALEKLDIVDEKLADDEKILYGSTRTWFCNIKGYTKWY